MTCTQFTSPKLLKRLGPEKGKPGLLFEIRFKWRCDPKAIEGSCSQQRFPGWQVIQIEHLKESINRIQSTEIPLFGLYHTPIWTVAGCQLGADPLHFRLVGFGFLRDSDNTMRQDRSKPFDHTIVASKDIKAQFPIGL